MSAAEVGAGDHLSNRLDNHLQIIQSLVRLQMEGATAEMRQALQSAIRRIETANRVYLIVEQFGSDQSTDLGDVMSRLVQAHADLARPGVSVVLEKAGAAIRVPKVDAREVLMICDELISNALRHGFPGGRHGTVVLRLALLDGPDRRVRISVTDDGAGCEYDPTRQQTSGLTVCRNLLAARDQALRFASGPGTTMFDFDIPLSDTSM